MNNSKKNVDMLPYEKALKLLMWLMETQNHFSKKGEPHAYLAAKMSTRSW